VHGDLLWAGGSQAEAAAAYGRAVQAARQSGARIFELRAAVRLCRAAPSPSATAELNHIYSEFTEGQGTRDLQEARSLLEVVVRKAGGV
jgi:predicted ATPase